nr:lytic transglycosylase domain-containing protein [Desulfitobacterium metallireducens]
MPLAQKIFYPYPYRPTVEKYAREYGVDPYLVIAVIRAESSFMPQSESHKGALGLMQLMPNTASDIAEKMDDKSFTQEELKDPEKNIQYGTWYLANLQKEFNNIALTVAAYNGGRGHVKEWISTQQIDPNNLQIADIPFQETRQYVQRVLQFYDKYKELYGY